MGMNIRLLFLLVPLCLSADIYAQEISGSTDDVIERIIDRGNEQEDHRAEADDLEYYRSHPIDVAHPVYGELIQLPMISPMTAESIILLSDTVEITDIERIRSAGLMNDVLYEQIRPFITIGTSSTPDGWMIFVPSRIESRTRTEERLSDTRGSLNGRFNGSMTSTYQRMKLTGGHTEMVMLFEKDPGETSADGFMAGAVSLKDVGFVKRLTLGDYSVAADQGLVLAKSMSSGKGNNVIEQVRKKGRTISSYASADELHFFRGCAIEASVDDWSIAGFYSRRELPAAVDSMGAVTSFYSSGVYRNDSERKKRNGTGERTIGAKVTFETDHHNRISTNILNVQYDHTFSRGSSMDGRSQRLTAASVGYDIPGKYISSFGEMAVNDLLRYGFSGGLIVQPVRPVTFSYHYRTYEQGYYTPYAHPFSERNDISEGESGHYFGLTFTRDNYSLNLYYDRAILPPVNGDLLSVTAESFISLELPVTKKFELYLHTRRKIRSQFADDERSQTNYRVESRLALSRSVLLTTRIEYTSVLNGTELKNETGVLLYADGSFRNAKEGIRLRSRLIFFDTQSYDSRLYQFESDVTGNYSNPPLYGQGIRWYVVFGYELFSDLVCSFKYSGTKKLHVTSMGSGDEMISGNSDTQLALQLDFQL